MLQKTSGVHTIAVEQQYPLGNVSMLPSLGGLGSILTEPRFANTAVQHHLNINVSVHLGHAQLDRLCGLRGDLTSGL
jgi:hypothetical protein